MAYRPVLLLLTALLLTLCGRCASEQDQFEMLRFLRSFAANFPNALESWKGDNYCSWKYIKCDGDKITLRIRGGRDELLDATGTLPDVTTDGVLLTHIDLDDCFTGPTTLPASWYRIWGLSWLELRSPFITGTLPPEWGQMPTVSLLSLVNTALTGTLPPEWFDMRNLKSLLIEQSSITGTLPPEWGNMSILETISIMQAPLTGSLPDAWRTLSKLEYLSVENTQMSGSLPASWGNSGSFPSLKYAYLLDNKFCGCEPDSWVARSLLHNALGNSPVTYRNCSAANACSLIGIDADTLQFLRSFAKSYPTPLSSWTGTDYCRGWSYITCSGDKVELNLQDVQLDATGTLPDVVSDSVLLTKIAVSFSFTAPTTLPTSWYRLAHLEHLEIASPKVTGTLPALWATMRALTELSIHNTSLTGALPADWSAMPSIKSISVVDSPITGTLPAAWGAMSKLQTLEVASTSVSGTLPAVWGYSSNMPSLTQLILTNNDKICGCEPDSWKARAVLHSSVADTPLAYANCSTANACGGSVTERPEEPNKNGAIGHLSGAVAALAAACTMALGLSL